MSFLKQAANAVGTPPKLTNYSPYAVPAFWLLTQAVHIYAITLTSGKFTNKSPREYVARLTAKEKKEPWERKFLRAEAAQQNGFEALGFFAAGVALANYAKLPVGELNQLTGLFLFVRSLYYINYLVVESEGLAATRSILWLIGQALTSTLFVKAGLRLNA